MSVERIPITSRAQWLELRRQDITASDIAAVCGVSPYKSALRLWAEKCGQVNEPTETNAMRRGRWLEDAVIAAVREEEGWQLVKPGFYIRDAEARIGATPDALAHEDLDSGANVPIQCKVVSRPIFDAGWQDGPPIGYQLQALTEAMLLDAPEAYVAALIIDTFNAELRTFKIDRHPAAEQRIRGAVAQFWVDVAAGRQPAADYSRDSDLLQVLYPPRKEIEPIDLSRDNLLPELLAERERFAELEKATKARLDEIKAELTDKLKGAPAAICNGWKVTNSLTHRKEHVVPACSYPVLRVTRLKEKAA